MNCDKNVALNRKCELLGIIRSSIYYRPKPAVNNDVVIMNEVHDIYQRHSFCGYRRMLVALRKRGFVVNHKRLQRLLCLAGIKAIYPGKKTTIKNPDHKVFPCILKGLKIERPNQVWQVDITYIKIRHGFVYLICLVDVFTRKIMVWALSIFLDTESCLEALDCALQHAKPEIINSDQGCQFTSTKWVDRMAHEQIKISMDGKGRWADNIYIERLWRSIKYENVFLHSFETVEQAKKSLREYIHFYNEQRHHQALNYHTPNAVYALKRIPTKQELFASFDLENNIRHGGATMIPKFI